MDKPLVNFRTVLHLANKRKNESHNIHPLQSNPEASVDDVVRPNRRVHHHAMSLPWPPSPSFPSSTVRQSSYHREFSTSRRTWPLQAPSWTQREEPLSAHQIWPPRHASPLAFTVGTHRRSHCFTPPREPSPSPPHHSTIKTFDFSSSLSGSLIWGSDSKFGSAINIHHWSTLLLQNTLCCLLQNRFCKTLKGKKN